MLSQLFVNKVTQDQPFQQQTSIGLIIHQVFVHELRQSVAVTIISSQKYLGDTPRVFNKFVA